ncbi:MAG: hypothetical protein JXB49_17420 [Bacteroidales bacterium]|nr:hypothetical protein [Bacteroidales bacterium]MBN2862174.1 hypothetical protein [Bacteroidales bacterium]
MTWKETLNENLGNLGYHRLDYPNALLDTYLREWGDYLHEFEGIGEVLYADIHPDVNYVGPERKYISVDSKTRWSGVPFRAYLLFSIAENNVESVLKIRYTESVKIENIPNFIRGHENELYNWSDLVLSQIDPQNQDALLEQLNNLLNNYLSAQ